MARAAALTGTIGQGGDNRIHDVALVQALLGLKRAKGGRMYLRDNHVTGKFDRPTAEALIQFRLDQGDRNVKGPLPPRGPMFSKLAQGQALAVLERSVKGTVPFIPPFIPRARPARQGRSPHRPTRAARA